MRLSDSVRLGVRSLNLFGRAKLPPSRTKLRTQGLGSADCDWPLLPQLSDEAKLGQPGFIDGLKPASPLGAFSATWPSWQQTGACLRLREECCISRKSPASPELFAASTNQFVHWNQTDRSWPTFTSPRPPSKSATAIHFLAVGSLIESGNAMPAESPAGIPEVLPRF